MCVCVSVCVCVCECVCVSLQEFCCTYIVPVGHYAVKLTTLINEN